MNIDYVKTPFTNNPSMTRLEGPAYNQNPNERYLAEKHKQLDLYGEKLYGETKISKEEGLREKFLKFCNLDTTLSLIETTTRLEEDFAIMYKGKMEMVSVCFPSGWAPKEKLGKHLSVIHEPIADSEQLIRASEKLSDYMTKQSIKRWVWTITTSKNLSEYPDFKKPEVSIFENLYFRVETQTTAPIDNLTSIFFIKVDVLPLAEVWDIRILESINSMTEEVLNYKSLTQIKELLNRMEV
tara:strand:- start:251 stop:970 length:720 start_codon:yes stop_codon:yes gene_type:complete